MDEAGLIRFDNVGLRYGLGPEVLRNVSFGVEPHSFHFLTGTSGEGKTTLMRLMYLALKPTRGRVTVFGKDVARLTSREVAASRRRIGVVFQDFRLLDHLTTYENVALPHRVQGREETSYRADVVELLEWVGLGARLHALPPVLSGGEKQRAAIARAVITKPEVLLADEPTGNVDPDLAYRLLYLFVELNKLGTGILIATHDHHLIREVELARHLVLDDGELTVLE
jgi:cell division transport system ATP-binding protein